MGIDRLAGRILIVEQRRRRHREVATPARKLLEAPPTFCRPGGQPDFSDQLVVLERRRQRAKKEVGGMDRPRALRAGHGDFSVAGDGDTGHLGSRIGMRDAASDGSTIADLIVSDMLHRGLEQRMCSRQPFVVLDVAPAHQRRADALGDILMSRNSGSLRRSTSRLGATIRKASMGIRLCPPAIGRASTPREASSATASERLPGQAYSSGGNFMDF
jgi:hypothetical protein